MKKTITVITKNDVIEDQKIINTFVNTNISFKDISILEIMEFKDDYLEIHTEEKDTIFLSKQVVGKVMEEFVKKFGI